LFVTSNVVVALDEVVGRAALDDQLGCPSSFHKSFNTSTAAEVLAVPG